MSETDLLQNIEQGLNDQQSWLGRQRAFGFIRPNMLKVTARYPELTVALRQMKEYAINHLDTLLPQAIQSLEAKGCKVFVSKSEQGARDYIAGIVQEQLVVKSKTNAGKEIGITQYLQSKGAKVIETDLGDRLTQLEGKGKSTHTLAPAIHLSMEACAKLLSKDVGRPLPNDETLLVQAARASLRDYLLGADVGISGANAIDAETGSVFVTENEGNIRCVTSMPRVHIVIAGIEKIVPTLADGLMVVKADSAYGVGQDIGTYVSVIDGVSQYAESALEFLGSAQGPEEVHVVFLTQGRYEAIAQGYGEALYCINCGSCLNFCPVYAEIGNHYGYKYLGGRGAIFAAFHGESLDKAQSAGLSLCIGCKRCEEACAVGMHTPEMIAHLRADVVEKKGLGVAKGSVFKLLAHNKLRGALKLARNFQSLGLKKTDDGQGSTARFDLQKLGVPTERLLPMLAERSLAEMLGKRSPLAKPKGRVAFFGGCVVNYCTPQLGIDVYDILMANQIEMVTFSDEACCGLPAIMGGDTLDALELAKTNIRLLSAKSYDYLLFVCPSCATTVKEEWAKLLREEKDEVLWAQYQTIQSKVIDLNAYLVDVLQVDVPKLLGAAKMTYHDPCHLSRGLEVTRQPRALLEAMGNELIEMEDPASCCGFGGSFSLFYYQLSSRVNDAKVQKIQEADADYVATSCPGCVMHIKDGLNRAHSTKQVVHMAELLAKASRGGRL